MKPTLALLLALSVVVNGVLIVKMRRAGSAAGREAGSKAPSEPSSASEMRTQLEAAREESRELRAQVDQLTAERGGAAPPVAVAAAKSGESLKDRMRKFLRLMKERKGSSPPDPDEMKSAMSFIMEYYPSLQSPSSDAGRFMDFTRAAYDATMEDGGTPLTEEQRRAFDKLTQDVAAALKQVPAAPFGDRQVAELDAQRKLASGTHELLSPEQRKLAQESDITRGMSGNQARFTSNLAQQVTDDWTGMFGAQPGQGELFAQAAREYAQASQLVQAEFRTKYGKVPPMYSNEGDPGLTLELRARMMKAQVDALKGIVGSMTEAQREVFNKKPLWEYYLTDGAPGEPAITSED